MTVVRRASIEVRLKTWLLAKKPPPHLVNDGAKDEFISQCCEAVEKYAPADGLDAWFGQVVERMLKQHKAHTWPAPAVWAICASGSDAKPEDTKAAPVMSAREKDFRLFCLAINKKYAVAEDLLFGHTADRALREGQITLEQLREYQRAAYVARKKVYGKARSLFWAHQQCEAFHADLTAPKEARPQHAADADEAGAL